MRVLGGQRTPSVTIETFRILAKATELIASFGGPLMKYLNVEVLEWEEVVAGS
jgi:hypothetical protein